MPPLAQEGGQTIENMQTHEKRLKTQNRAYVLIVSHETSLHNFIKCVY